MGKVLKRNKKGLKRRRCLACSQSFPSEGPHNRICPKCKSTKAWRDGQAKIFAVEL